MRWAERWVFGYRGLYNSGGQQKCPGHPAGWTLRPRRLTIRAEITKGLEQVWPPAEIARRLRVDPAIR